MARGLLWLFAAALALAAAQDKDVFKEVHVWRNIDFAWPHDTTKAKALDSRQFQPENCAVQGIRVWRDRVFLSLPRWRQGVPATLASIPVGSQQPSPPLEPFPSWEMQAVGNCSALQFVHNVEITPEGRMWVLDSGRVHPLDNVSTACPPKIVILDLNSGGAVVKAFTLPPDVASQRGDTLLADIVVDEDEMAYVSDASDSEPGVVVFDSRGEQAWKVRDTNTMAPDPAADVRVPAGAGSGVSALALSPRASASTSRASPLLFYAPLRSYQVYSIGTDVLRNRTATPQDLSRAIILLGSKTSFGQAMIMDSHGFLYFGLNGNNSIARWDTTQFPINQHMQVVSRDDVRLQWPSSFAFDTAGFLWVVSNRLQNFFSNAVNVDDTNYRIMSAFIGTKSYMYIDEGRFQPTEISRPGAEQTSSTKATNTFYESQNLTSTSDHPPHNDTRMLTSSQPNMGKNELLLIAGILLIFSISH